MLWFKKKNKEIYEDGNKFLKRYAGQINSLIEYTGDNETVSMALNTLKEAYYYAVSPKVMNKEVKQYRENIEKMFNELREALRSREWDEKDVMFRIADLKSELGMLTSVNKK